MYHSKLKPTIRQPTKVPDLAIKRMLMGVQTSMVAYKNVQIVSPVPTQPGGLALNNNFIALADQSDALTTAIAAVLPSQTGNFGKFLSTDGTSANWTTVASGSVSSVAGRTGAVTLTSSDIGLSSVINSLQLTASSNLADLSSVSAARTNLGLGSAATQNSSTFDAAGSAAAVLPSQTSNSGKFLSTNGATASWTAVSAGAVLSVAGKTGAVTLTSSDVGLSGVINSLQLTVSNNLSDLSNVTAAQTNLGLGSAATQNSSAFDTAGSAAAVLPSQPSNSGRFLSTDGTNASWTTLPVVSVAGKTGAVTLSSSDVGLGSVANNLQLTAANNLSDLTNAATARTNLGLGSAATQSSSAFAILSASNTFTADQTIAAHNLVTDTTTGMKIGTSTAQKLGFFNSTPIVQPSNTTDLRTAFINLGLLATGGATPLNLNGGAFAASRATLTLSNSDYTNTAGANSLLLMSNPSSFGQNVVSSVINGNVVAKWRTDYVGNISWAAGPTGSHNFYVQGDYPDGVNPLNIYNSGNVSVGQGNSDDGVNALQVYGSIALDYGNIFTDGSGDLTVGFLYSNYGIVSPVLNIGGYSGGATAGIFGDGVDDVLQIANSGGGASVRADGYIQATTFFGDGSNLTGLNAATISSGTVADARLSSNVAFKNAANTWTADQTVAAHNLITDTTTGTKIGTSTSQKLGFFNSTPIVQPANTTDLRTAIINLGLLASGGATPLNLNGGTLTALGATLSTLSLGVSSPTATLHIKAGTSSAASAPIKLTTGTLLTTPEDGAVEYAGSHLYFTVGSTRYQVDQQSGGSGSVSSVALALPSVFTVTGSPITTTGTLTATLSSQTANLILASPDGASGSPTFRAFVVGDLPTSGVTAATYTNATVTVDNKGRITSASSSANSSRTTVTHSTSSLTNGTTDTVNTTVALGKSFGIFKVTTSVYARVRVYATNADRAADLSRGLGVTPTPGTGLILEFVTNATYPSIDLGPMVTGANLDTSVISNVYIAVTNTSGSTATITTTFTILKLES